MTQTYNVYCDESCHLEHDHQKVMVLGGIWCPVEKVREISTRLREIKVQHGVKPELEIKWTKVSPAKTDMYLHLVDYFFDDDDLHFRALVVPDKSILRHDDYAQDHDTWYYKMYFDMLKVLLSPRDRYRIYLDIKDTRSADKVEKLQQVLRNSLYDFSGDVVERVQTVRSHEVEILQIADLLIGAIAYLYRGLSGNAGKEALIARIKERSGYSLKKSTLYKEEKFNLFVWHPSERCR
ncbi:MAG: DUF3800 domain-containing protein [Geopsychrobacter sp.]|nr:DUF3800 domain-containing protein [Geopsychrobacter sp.]